MSEPLVSVVIPIYNPGDFLRPCLQSLSEQTCGDWEAVMIDDGSTDGSGDICAEFAAADRRFQLYTQPNAGLSASRNRAIREARGKYLLFLDSDDRLLPDAIRSLCDIAEREQVEIVSGHAAMRVFPDGLAYPYGAIKPGGGIIDGKALLLRYIDSGINANTVWTCLYRCDFIAGGAHFFREGIYHEDELWTPQVMLSAQRVIIADLVFYLYSFNSASITEGGRTPKHYRDYFAVFAELDRLFATMNDPAARVRLQDSLAAQYITVAARLSGEDFSSGMEGEVDRQLIRRNVNFPRTALKYTLLLLAPRTLGRIQRKRSLKVRSK